MSMSATTRTARGRLIRTGQYLALAGYLLFLGFPLVFLTSASLKSPTELQSARPTLLPRSLHLSNYSDAFERVKLADSALNSLLVALGTTVVVTAVALPAAYALARFKTRLRGAATGWILLSQVFPFILVIIPLFLVLKDLGLVDSLLGLVLVYSVWSLPFALWMLQGYVAGIPLDLEHAAAIDGASRGQVLTKVVMPLLAPGLVATSLFTFISAWNEFFFALVLIQNPEKETLPLTLARFIGAEGQVQLGPLAAAALLATIPSLVFFSMIQRRLTSGLLSGAVKG